MKKAIFISILLGVFFAGSAFAQQNKVVVVPLGSSSATGITYFSEFGVATDNTISFTYELFYTLGSFTKTRSDTAIKVHYRSQVAQTGSVGQFVEYELRLNGQQSDTGADYSGVVVYMDSTTHYSTIDPWDLWTGLPAGTYNVELWIRGNATSTELNDGNFRRPVLVEEIAYKTSPTPAPLSPLEGTKKSASGTTIIGGEQQ